MVAGFMVPKMHLIMIEGDITLENVSSKDPLISSLGMPDHFMRYIESIGDQLSSY